MKLLLLCLLLNQNIHFQKENVKIIYVPYYERLTNDEIIKQLEITKEYDKFEFNIQPTFSYIGTKDYILYAIDKKGNQDIYDFKINIYDDVPPSIYGPNEIILKDNKTNINLLLNYYTSNDEIDGYLKTFIEETSYSKNEYKSSYYIKLISEDKSKNIARKTIKIFIDNNNYSFYYKKNPSITMYKRKKYYPNDFIKILKETNQLENVKFDDYYLYNSTNNYFYEEKTGIYQKQLFIKQKDNEVILDISINVIDENIKEEPIVYKLIRLIIKLIKEIIK